MAPVPQGLLPPPCPPPFLSPPTLPSVFNHLYIDPTHTSPRDSNPNPINPSHPTLTVHPPGYDTLSLHPNQPIHDTPTFHPIKNIHHTSHLNPNHTHHTRLFHHKHQTEESNSSHFPLNLLLLPLFIFLLLTTIYHLFSWTHGHEEYTSSDPDSFPSYSRQPSHTLNEGFRPGSVSDWSSLYSDDEDEKGGKGGKKKLGGEELNERSRLLDKYNGANAYVFEEEWEVERFCRMKGYGACSEERRRLEKGLRGEGVGILVVFDD